MKLHTIQHDEEALAALGRRLAGCRIRMNRTQAELAREAGVGKRTLERLEAGESTQTLTLLRVLRELELLEALDALLPESGAGPRQIVQNEGETRKRASNPMKSRPKMKKWTWGDEA
ncbi:MAG: helix-turn-helix transcriptional regulator [Kiritimatiellia bacterium]